MVTVTFGVTSPQETADLEVDDARDVLPGRRPVRPGRGLLWVPPSLVLGLGLLGLDRHTVWRDEAASLVAARRSLPELWSMLRHVETVHAVYYNLLHVWLQLGSSEAWARMPSVLAMTAAAGLVGVVGARLVSVPLGLLAGLLFALNPSVSYYAQEARSTALVAALALLSSWLLLRSLGRRSTWWVAYAVTCALLVGLNLLAALVPMAHALTLLLWRRRRRTLTSWAAAVAPALVVALVLAGAVSRQPFQIGWIPQPGISSVRDLAHLALGPNVPLVVLAAALVLLGSLPTRSEPERRLRQLALPMAVLPSAALLTMSLVQPIFVSRYVFPSVAAAALLAALGALRLGRSVASRTSGRAVGLVAAAVVLAVAVGGISTQRFDRTAASRADDLAGAAAVVGAGARTGDAMLFLPSNRHLLAQVYPGSFRGLRDVGVGGDPVEDGTLTGRPLPLSVTLHNLSASDRVWAIGRPGLALLPSEADARTELALLDRDFRPVERAGARGIGVTLYVRRLGSS